MLLGPAHLHPCLHSHFHCATSSTCVAHSPKCCCLQWAGTALPLSNPWGWLTRTFVIKAIATMFPRGFYFLKHSRVLPPVMGRTNSPSLTPSGPALPPDYLPQVVRGVGERHLSGTHATHGRRVALRLALPHSCPQVWLTCTPSIRASPNVLPKQGTGPTLPKAAAGERQN